MNDLIVVEKIAQWRRLKALVLDSVSSPITKRVYNMALDEFMAWFRQEPRPGFTKATVSAWRVSLEARGLGSSSIIIRMSAIRKLAAEAADNGLIAPELAAGIPASRASNRPDSGWELAVAAAGAGSPKRAGRSDREGPARSRHPRRSARLRSPPVRGRGAHLRPRPATRRSVVHCRSSWKAWPDPNGTDADLGQSGDRCLDLGSRDL